MRRVCGSTGLGVEKSTKLLVIELVAAGKAKVEHSQKLQPFVMRGGLPDISDCDGNTIFWGDKPG